MNRYLQTFTQKVATNSVEVTLRKPIRMNIKFLLGVFCLTHLTADLMVFVTDLCKHIYPKSLSECELFYSLDSTGVQWTSNTQQEHIF